MSSSRGLTRREALHLAAAGGAGFAGALLSMRGIGGLSAKPLLASVSLRPAPPVANPAVHEINLVATESATRLPLFGGKDLPAWGYDVGGLAPNTAVWPPVIRARVGDRIRAHVTNRLPDDGTEMRDAAVHWHGIRLTNSMDGVSFLTQQPIKTGETFAYDFTLPDAGTFFFHGHCDAAQSIGRGLIGTLIVEGDETEPYDGEVVLVSKDWRLSDEGGFLPFITSEGASKAGTFGTRRSINGIENPQIDVPAGADVRLRFLQVDPTRIVELGIEGGDAAVIAIDGHAVAPFPLSSWRMGPGMRVDLVVRTPAEGGIVTLFDYFSAKPVPMARLVARGEPERSGPFSPAPLYAPRFEEPDAANAIALPVALSATAVPDDIPLPNGETIRFADAVCLNGQTFWALNKRSWPEKEMAHIPAPLAILEKGKTYRVTLQNATPHQHPMHIHGLVFKVVGSSKRDRPVHWADTVLVLPKERLDVLILADNPGDWMLHCHILEHQETGMMGFIRVG